MHIIALIIAFFIAAPAFAATPTHDASSNSGAKNNEQTTQGPYQHTAGTLTNGIAIIRVASQDSTPGTISGVTYNGVAAEQIGSTLCYATSNRSCLSLWYVLNPPAGASNVVASFSEVMNWHAVNVSTYSNVNQSIPVVEGELGTQLNFDVTGASEARVSVTSAVGELVVGACSFASATAAAATTDTDRGAVFTSGNTAYIGLEDTGAASVTLSCTNPETRNNAIMGISLKATSDSTAAPPLFFN